MQWLRDSGKASEDVEDAARTILETRFSVSLSTDQEKMSYYNHVMIFCFRIT